MERAALGLLFFLFVQTYKWRQVLHRALLYAAHSQQAVCAYHAAFQATVRAHIRCVAVYVKRAVKVDALD